MSTAVIDVTIGDTAWVDITTATSIAAGTALILQNKTIPEIYVQLSASAPSGDKEGFILSNIYQPSHSMTIPAGGVLKVWARAARYITCIVGVRDNS